LIPSSADGAFLLWLHLLGGGDQLRSLTLTDSEEVCARPGVKGTCDGTKTTKGRPPRDTFICERCRQPWKPRIRALLEMRHKKPGRKVNVRVRGKVPRMHRESLFPIEQNALDYGMLVEIIESVPRDMTPGEWWFVRLAFASFLSADGKSSPTDQAVVYGAEHFSHYRTPRWWWSHTKVEEACRVAREKIERRLARARRGGRFGAHKRSRSHGDVARIYAVAKSS